MKSEASQHIYEFHFDKLKKTEFGNRAMTEVGNIKGLEVDEVKNYILIPMIGKDNKSTSWSIREIDEQVKKWIMEEEKDDL